ncbi:MAG: hypothetical protein U0232_03835 [Thermomicrobiales bacterium]
MFNTFERDLIANERHQDFLRAAIKREQIELATGDRAGGLLAFFTGRRRDAATARPGATATATRAA